MAQTNDAHKVLKIRSRILKVSITRNLNKITTLLEATGVSAVELSVIINAIEYSLSEYKVVLEKLLGRLINKPDDEIDCDRDVQEFCDAHDDYLIKIGTELAKIEEQYSAPVTHNDASGNTVTTQQFSCNKHLIERKIL